MTDDQKADPQQPSLYDLDDANSIPPQRIAEFDPTPYLRKLGGRRGTAAEYLDVKHRLLWLRREHPDAEIVTEHIRIDESAAIFKATVSIPGGGKATGHGSETAGDFGDFIEKAETKALGRALNALGYGAQFADQEERATGLSQHPRESDRRPQQEQSQASADYSWSSFWRWARTQGIDTRDALEKELEEPVGNLNPAELRAKLMSRRESGPNEPHLRS